MMMPATLGIQKAIFALLCLSFLLPACNKSHDIGDGNRPSGCLITLYQKDRFKGNAIILQGPANYLDLKAIPGSSKNWEKVAQSFEATGKAVVVFWKEPDLRGDSISYPAASMISQLPFAPGSLKIKCD